MPNLDDLTVKKCEQEDSPCIVKKIGKSILSHFTRVLCMQKDKTSLVLKYSIIKILLCLQKIVEKMQLICVA